MPNIKSRCNQLKFGHPPAPYAFDQWYVYPVNKHRYYLKQLDWDNCRMRQGAPKNISAPVTFDRWQTYYHAYF